MRAPSLLLLFAVLVVPARADVLPGSICFRLGPGCSVCPMFTPDGIKYESSLGACPSSGVGNDPGFSIGNGNGSVPLTVGAGVIPQIMQAVISSSKKNAAISDGVDANLRRIASNVDDHVASVRAATAAAVKEQEKELKSMVAATAKFQSSVDQLKAALPQSEPLPPGTPSNDEDLTADAGLVEAERQVATSDRVIAGNISPHGPDLGGIMSIPRERFYARSASKIDRDVARERWRVANDSNIPPAVAVVVTYALDGAQKFAERGALGFAQSMVLQARAYRFARQDNLPKRPVALIKLDDGTVFWGYTGAVPDGQRLLVDFVKGFESRHTQTVQAMELAKLTHGPKADEAFKFQFDTNARYLTWIKERFFSGRLADADAALQYAALSGADNLQDMASAFREFDGNPPSDIAAQVALQTSRICGAIVIKTQDYSSGDTCARARKIVMRYIHAQGAERDALREPADQIADELESQYDIHLTNGGPTEPALHDKWVASINRLKIDKELRSAYLSFWKARWSVLYAEQEVERKTEYEPPEDPISEWLSGLLFGKIINRIVEHGELSHDEHLDWKVWEFIENFTILLKGLTVHLDAGRPLDDAMFDRANAEIELFKAEQELHRLLDAESFNLLTTPLPPRKPTYDLPSPDNTEIPPVIKLD